MSAPYAKVVADSITEWGDRLTTFEVRMHRFVLAEFNTHRVFSRNSASSRAIPVEKQLAKLIEDPAFPLEWPAEQPGMQGGTALEGDDHSDAVELFEGAHDYVSGLVKRYLKKHPEKPARLHKSLVNRLMEPWMWHTVVVTATAWENFFRQRVSPLAQPEIRVAAEHMHRAFRTSEPLLLIPGRYHLPYTDNLDRQKAVDALDGRIDPVEIDRYLVPISSARCARVSYLTQDGRRDFAEDGTLYERLTTSEPMHASPLEHVATPAPWNKHEVHLSLDEVSGLVIPVQDAPGCTVSKTLTLPLVGNFVGWQQHRLAVELTKDYAFNA